MDIILENIAVILPLIIINYTLAAFALLHALKNPHYRFGNKIMWVLIILFINFIGSIVYFVFGRGEE
jgi:hypothetical protein